MTIISTTVGRSTLKKWSSHHRQQKSPKCSTWMQSQKRQNDLYFQGKPFNITVIQIYALTSNTEEVEVELFYEDLQDFLELTLKKDVLFIIGGWNAKVGNQEITGVTFSTYRHYQMVNTKIKFIISFAGRDGEALYSQQKQDQELTVAQIMNSLLPNSD